MPLHFNTSLPFWALVVTALCLTPACRTARPLPVVDTSQPGWHTQQFPALWRPPGRDSVEMAGDLWVTRHADGRVLVGFAKVPFPNLTAWRTLEEWQIEFQPQRRRLQGRGTPPHRCLWLWVPEMLDKKPLPALLRVEAPPGRTNALRLRHAQSGEMLTLFFPP